MALRVELNKEALVQALDDKIKSFKRAGTTNPRFKQILDEDIARFQNAINTITEIK